MYIKSVEVKNFKCFNDNKVEFCIPDGTTAGSGLNIFVGENNSGKSSLMEAIYFIRNKGQRSLRRIMAGDEEDFYITQTFTGNIENVIDNFVQDNKKQVFKDAILSHEGEHFFKVKRNFKSDDDVKKILFCDPSNDSFSNKSGIDAPFSAFFQISNIWADTNPENEIKFGSSSVCGNLLADISEKFKFDHEAQFASFMEVFNKTFNDNTSGLQADLNQVAKETEEVLNAQFGQATLRFRFDNPEPSYLFKNIKIFVNDGEETELIEKGHGMQRAVILSLLQVYAKRITEIKDGDGNVKLKPHFLFIDEPEMGLHPQAQKQLFEALKLISKTHQVFIATHSENFISTDLIENIYKFQKTEDGIIISSGKDLKIDLKVNRKFFFHHHKLFFAKRALFVEGVDDYDRYPRYCEANGFANLRKDFYLLAGCGDYSVFKKLCDHFAIESHFIFDLDTIGKSSMTFKNVSDEMWNDIQTLNKICTHKDSSPLFDNNINPTELALKNKIIDGLKEFKLHILPNGAVEQYLDENCEIIGADTAEKEARKNELNNILSLTISSN